MTRIANRLTPTTRSIDDLYQLFREGRLDIQPDYQRNSVWPPKAQAVFQDRLKLASRSTVPSFTP